MKRTPLYEWHSSNSNNVVSFGGFFLPVYYSSIVEEHLNGTHPVDLVAVGSVDLTEFAGPILDGYIPGDMIELRLWSVNKAVELKVSADLSDMQYGNAMG